MASSKVEDYLKRIYLERQRSGEQLVPMGRLAESMDVAPGTATAMVKSLAAAGLVHWHPYAGVRLSRNGVRLALGILRRHRLVELFLVRVLGMDWSEVHVEAERLEHAVSDRVLERMDALLDHPAADPHGDPIPTADGDVDPTRHGSLAEAAAGERVRVVRILDQSPAFLKRMARTGLRPGCAIRIAERDEAADTVTVRPPRRAAVTLGRAAARKVLVESAR